MSPTGRLRWPAPNLQRLPSDEEVRVQAARLRAAWRKKYPLIVRFWADLERRIP